MNAETSEDVLTITGPQGRINRVMWGPLNKTIISAGEDATIRIWDAEVWFSSVIFELYFSLVSMRFFSFGAPKAISVT